MEQLYLALIAFMVTVLVALIGWIGNRIFVRMDRIHELLREAEKDVYERIDDHEKRLTKVETHCEINRRAVSAT